MNKEISAGTADEKSTKADNQHVSPACIKPNVGRSAVEIEAPVFDKFGREIKEFSVIKVFHFIGARRKQAQVAILVAVMIEVVAFPATSGGFLMRGFQGTSAD